MRDMPAATLLETFKNKNQKALLVLSFRMSLCSKNKF